MHVISGVAEPAMAPAPCARVRVAARGRAFVDNLEETPQRLGEFHMKRRTMSYTRPGGCICIKSILRQHFDAI